MSEAPRLRLAFTDDDKQKRPRMTDADRRIVVHKIRRSLHAVARGMMPPASTMAIFGGGLIAIAVALWLNAVSGGIAGVLGWWLINRRTGLPRTWFESVDRELCHYDPVNAGAFRELVRFTKAHGFSVDAVLAWSEDELAALSGPPPAAPRFTRRRDV